ncbi:MAG: DUF4239 domain-containing protein [Verrucomicrobiota bacterium]
MNPTTYGLEFAGGLFLSMLLLLEAGRRIAIRRLAQDPDGAHQGFSVVEGAVFSLLGLLIAFTFSGAATRFDGRRQLIVEEANSIGTAYLRIQLLPASAQPGLRKLFRQYLDARLETYRNLPGDIPAAQAEWTRSLKLQDEIWSSAVAACGDSGSQPAHMLLLPALNQMIDITAVRTEATKIHPPLVIFVMLGLLSLAASLLAGYGMAGGRLRSWIHILCFASVVASTVYVIVDIEYPRFGLIRVDGADRVLSELRESMK